MVRLSEINFGGQGLSSSKKIWPIPFKTDQSLLVIPGVGNGNETNVYAYGFVFHF